MPATGASVVEKSLTHTITVPPIFPHGMAESIQAIHRSRMNKNGRLIFRNELLPPGAWRKTWWQPRVTLEI